METQIPRKVKRNETWISYWLTVICVFQAFCVNYIPIPQITRWVCLLYLFLSFVVRNYIDRNRSQGVWINKKVRERRNRGKMIVRTAVCINMANMFKHVCIIAPFAQVLMMSSPHKPYHMTSLGCPKEHAELSKEKPPWSQPNNRRLKWYSCQTCATLAWRRAIFDNSNRLKIHYYDTILSNVHQAPECVSRSIH